VIFRIDSLQLDFRDRASTPVLFIHGAKDEIVPRSQVDAMVTALDKASHEEHPVIIYEQAGHGWSGFLRTHANEQMFSFFDKQLKGKTDTTLTCSPYPSCL